MPRKQQSCLSRGYEKRCIQKYIHDKLPTSCRQIKYYNYKIAICSTCNLEVETWHGILTCSGCIKIIKVRDKYILDSGVLILNNHTNQSCSTIISQNFSNYLNHRESIPVKERVPDATKTVLKTFNKQQQLGWQQWMKCWISRVWGALQNHDLKTKIIEIKMERLKTQDTSISIAAKVTSQPYRTATNAVWRRANQPVAFKYIFFSYLYIMGF
jgi:hypothetical protein